MRHRQARELVRARGTDAALPAAGPPRSTPTRIPRQTTSVAASLTHPPSAAYHPLPAAYHPLPAALRPPQWQHIFIPVLPRSKFSYASAPMPFVVGALARHLPELEREAIDPEVIFVDLDSGKLWAGDAETLEAAQLPRPLGGAPRATARDEPAVPLLHPAHPCHASLPLLRALATSRTPP